MSNLGFQFDATKVDPQGDYTPLEPGVYKCMIVESEVKPNSAGTGSVLHLNVEVCEGKGKGFKIRDFINIVHEKTQVQEIGQRQLSSICHAVGKMNVSDSSELHHKPFMVNVDVEPGRPYTDNSGNQREGNPQNRIKSYKPVDAGNSLPASTPSAATSNAAQDSQQADAGWG